MPPVLIAVVMLAAQQVPPGVPPITRYAITSADSTHFWPDGKKQIVSADILDAISADLEQRLNARNLRRVPTLNFQCCAIQLQVTNFASRNNESFLAVRATVMDIDRQQLYTNEYTAQAKSLKDAAAKIADAAMKDPTLLKKIKVD